MRPRASSLAQTITKAGSCVGETTGTTINLR
jgi:hypothetical protein